MPNLAAIREGLAAHEPALANPSGGIAVVAGVAVIVHEPAGAPPELLLIERAQSERDPWSGQMAFPGGRYDSGDRDLEATASRETLEEIGVQLARPLGRLDDATGGRPPDQHVLVASYVYELPERPELRPNHEVSSTIWIPLPSILDPESAVLYRFEHDEFRGSFPAFRYDRYTVWGLTYRILGSFVKIVGRSLPSHEGRESGQQESD